MSLVRFRPEAYADLAHLVERDLAKVEVAGSSPVIRLKKDQVRLIFFVCFNAFRQLSTKCETDNHPLCGWATKGYTKKTPKVVQ